MVLCDLLSHAGGRRHRGRMPAVSTDAQPGLVRRRGMPRLGRTLASRILVAVLGIVVITMAVGFALFARLTTHEADARAIEQATGIAVTLGRVPEVAQAVQDGDPGHVLARLGEQVRAGTKASYVVIIDRDGIRHSHPQPVPDRTTHRGTGRCARRPGPHGDRRGQPRPVRQRACAHRRRLGTPGRRGVGRHPRVGGQRPAQRRGARHRPLQRDRPRPRHRGLPAPRPDHQARHVRCRALGDRGAHAGA